MFFMDAEQLASPASQWREPLAIVDLSAADRMPCGSISLPPCPVVGLGDRGHPLAAQLDLIVEPPVTLGSLVESILSKPLGAANAVMLLRDLEGLTVTRALGLESLVYGLLQGSSEHREWLEEARAAPGHAAGTLQISRHGRTLDIVLDRPETHNAIDRTMRDALYAAFEIAALDPDVSQVRMTANGKAFCIGAELGEFGTTRDPAVSHLIRKQTLPAHQLAKIGHKLEVEITGACVGAGLEMAAFARTVIASEHAWFQLPELAMGLIPGAGGCVSLSRRIGRQRTALMILSGKRVGLQTALDWGIVDIAMDD